MNGLLDVEFHIVTCNRCIALHLRRLQVFVEWQEKRKMDFKTIKNCREALKVHFTSRPNTDDENPDTTELSDAEIDSILMDYSSLFK